MDPWGLSKCSLGKETGRYSAMKPGALTDEMAGTFVGGRYRELVLSKDTEFYRAGVSGKPFGQFFSMERPQSVIQTRVDKAVLPRWPNGAESPLNTVYKIKMPAGTKVYVGDVSYQDRYYLGGTEKVVILKPWGILGGEVLGEWPLL